MENFGVKLNNKSAYALIFISFVVILVGSLFTITHWKGASDILLLGLFFQLLILIYFLADIFKSNIPNKGFWMLYLFIFAPITQLVYIYRRNKIIQNNK
jgi:hypothetical protein